MSTVVLVIAGGSEVTAPVAAAVADHKYCITYCIAADSGADHAMALDLQVDVIVGDMDSISEDAQMQYQREGVEFDYQPADKDKTDFELALDRAIGYRPDKVTCIGIGGGRIDHLLGNFAVLASDRYASTQVEALVGTSRITVVRGNVELVGSIGEPVSLLPISGPANDVSVSGLEYELDAELLAAGSSRGISNRFVNERARISVGRGVLLAVQPLALV